MKRIYEVIIPPTMKEHILLQKTKSQIRRVRQLYPESEIMVKIGCVRSNFDKCPHCGCQCVDKNDNYCVMCGNALKGTAN